MPLNREGRVRFPARSLPHRRPRSRFLPLCRSLPDATPQPAETRATNDQAHDQAHHQAPYHTPDPATNPPIPPDTATDTQVPLLDPAEIDPAALTELETSILLTGLRQPIEVWKFSAPRTDENGVGHPPDATGGLMADIMNYVGRTLAARFD